MARHNQEKLGPSFINAIAHRAEVRMFATRLGQADYQMRVYCRRHRRL